MALPLGCHGERSEAIWFGCRRWLEIASSYLLAMTRFESDGAALGVSLRTKWSNLVWVPPLAWDCFVVPPRNDTFRERWRCSSGVIANASEAIWFGCRRWLEIASSCLLAMTRFEGGGVALGVSLRTQWSNLVLGLPRSVIIDFLLALALDCPVSQDTGQSLLRGQKKSSVCCSDQPGDKDAC